MKDIKKLFSPAYYIAVLLGKEKFRPFLAALILAIFFSIRISIFIFTDIYPVVKNLEAKVLTVVDEVYPEELEIIIKNGIVKTNMTEPLFITIRRETLNNLLSLNEDKKSSSKVRLLAIDTKGRAEDFERYQTYALLTEGNVIYYSDNEIKLYSLRNIQDMTINKGMIVDNVKKFKMENIVTWLVYTAPLLIAVISFITQITVFLFLTILSYIMVRINQVPAGFRNTFNFTSSIAFMAILFWNIVSLVPMIGFNLEATSTLLITIILSLCYLGIKKAKEATTNITA